MVQACRRKCAVMLRERNGGPLGQTLGGRWGQRRGCLLSKGKGLAYYGKPQNDSD
jgi:hypothetical protein